MRDEEIWRPPGSDRLPRRPTDRSEDAVAWLLLALAGFVMLVALVVGLSVHSAGVDRARMEAGQRWQVTAVLLEK